MDREGFKNRIQQYKKAREENPGLKYWEWKAQPAEKNIPKYDLGGEVRDNTYVAPIEKEQVFIPATGATKFLLEYRKRTPKAGNLEIVSPEFDLLTGIRAAAMLPTKAEKLGRILDNSDFITDDKITDLINSKYISDLTTFTKKNKNDANWYVHTDLGKSSSVFAGKGKGAYIHDKQLHPGEALIFDLKPYVWWNQGKRYTNLGENKDGYQAIVIKNNNAKDLLQVKSSQSPIGLWNGKQGFVLPSEYVTHDAVNLTPDILHYVYDALTKTYGNVKHYAEGTDGVTGPPTYEQWNAEMNQYNPTILDNASMYWSIEAAKKALHNEAMKLPGYAERWTEYYRSLPKTDPDINEFVDELWANENPNNAGLKNGKYYPHKSPEGGKPTIGPGFKLDSGSHDISTKTANRGMTKTRLDQEARKIGKQHLKAVDQFINYGQTTNPADTVSPQIKMGLMDLRHQVGPLNEWGNLRQAVLNGDLEGIRKESTVTWNDNGKIKVDDRRKKIRDEKYFHYAEGTDQVEPTPKQILENSKPRINGIPINDPPLENVFSPFDVMLGTVYKFGPLVNKILPNYGPTLGALVFGTDYNKVGNQPLVTKKLDPDVSEFYNDIVIPMNPNDAVYKQYFINQFRNPNIEIHPMNNLPDGFAADFNPNNNLIRIGDKYALSPNYQQFETHEYGHLLDKYLPYDNITQQELNNALPVSKTPISKDSDTYRERQSTKREAEFKTFKKLKDAGKLKVKTARAKTKRYQEYLANATDEEILELLGADTAYKKDYLNGNIDLDTLRRQMMYAPTIAAGIVVPTSLLEDDKEWT